MTVLLLGAMSLGVWRALRLAPADDLMIGRVAGASLGALILYFIARVISWALWRVAARRDSVYVCSMGLLLGVVLLGSAASLMKTERFIESARSQADMRDAARDVLDSVKSYADTDGLDPEASDQHLDAVEELAGRMESAATTRKGLDRRRLEVLAASVRELSDAQRPIAQGERDFIESGLYDWRSADEPGVLEAYIAQLDAQRARTQEFLAFMRQRPEQLRDQFIAVGHEEPAAVRLANEAAGGAVFPAILRYWELSIASLEGLREQFQFLIDHRGEWGWDRNDLVPVFTDDALIDEFNGIYQRIIAIAEEQTAAQREIIEHGERTIR